MAVTWTTQRTGNWSLASDNASSPWHDGGTQTGYARTPGSSSNVNNDLVRIANGHTLTCDASVTIGDATTPATSAIACASSSGTGVLSVSTGVTLTVVSNVVQANATWTFAAGSGLTFNSSTALTWQIGAAHSQANAALNMSGSSGSHVTVASSGSANGSFTTGSFIGGGKGVLTWVDFSKIGVASTGTGTAAAWTFYPANGYSCTFNNCTWDSNCGRVELNVTMTATAVFRIEDCTHDSTGQCVGATLGSTNAISGGGVRSIQRNYFAGSIGNGSNGGMQRDFTIVGNVCWPIYGFAGATSAGNWSVSGNLIRKTFQGTLTFNGATSESNAWNYLHAHNNSSQIVNHHGLGYNNAAAQDLAGWVFDPGNTDTAGDWVNAASPSSALAYGLKYGLFLPIGTGASAGLHSGTIASMLGNANFSLSVTHCTSVCDADNLENGAVRYGETYAGYAGILSAVKSNLAWASTAGKAAILTRANNNSAASDGCAAANADYNATWNAITTGTAGGVRGYKDYAPAPTNPMFSSTVGLGAHDVTLAASPFVDTTRNIASWAVSKGQASSGDSYNTKSDAAYAYIKAGAATNDVANRIADLVAWVKAGWKVTASSLHDTGHDSLTIGALDWQASGSGAVKAMVAGMGVI